MKKKVGVKRRHLSHARKPKRFHHRVISFFKGDGGIYVIFILATVMAGAFALTGGILPQLSQNPTAADQVEIDENSAKQSSTSALQLVDIKIKPTATPTPPPPTATVIPTLFLTPTPTQSPTPVACLNKTAINLVLDVSTSMNADGKLAQLNTALGAFVDQLKDDTVVGAVKFAGLASFPNTNGAVTQLPFTRYKDNKTLVRDRLTKLTINTSSANDGTYFRSAFTTAINNINAVKSNYESQGYKFVSIVFTDGVPETQYTDNDCVVEVNNPYVCFARKQDPRTDLTKNLKTASSRVYSIGIYSGQREQKVLPQAKQLLADIASNPSYTTNSTNPSSLTGFFKNIITSVCN